MYPVLVPHHDRGWTDAYPLTCAVLR